MRIAINVIAFMILAIFLLILAGKLMRLDLGLLVLVTLLMVGYDLFFHDKKKAS